MPGDLRGLSPFRKILSPHIETTFLLAQIVETFAISRPECISILSTIDGELAMLFRR